MAHFFHAVKETLGKSEVWAVTALDGEWLGHHALFQGKNQIYSDFTPALNGLLQIALGEATGRCILPLLDHRFFLEPLAQPEELVICGGGHVSVALVRMAKMLELSITVVEDRQEFAQNAKNAGADRVICAPFVEALEAMASNANRFYTILTRGHTYDIDCLSVILQKESRYVGMIGSKVRAKKVLEGFLAKGVSQEKLDSIYTPIGLDIKAQTPEEIAVSILAELISVKNDRKSSMGYPDELLDVLCDPELATIGKTVVTIVGKRGSAPREVGTKMLVLEDGTMIGTIGGGCVESDLKRNALRCLSAQKAVLQSYDMTGEEGMVCGGVVDVLIEPVRS